MLQNTMSLVLDDLGHITPVWRQLHWLPVRQRIEFKLAVLVCKVLNALSSRYLADDCRLTTTTCRRRLRFPTSPCVRFQQVARVWAIDHSRTATADASSCLWNQLPSELRLPADHEDLSLSSDLTHVSSSFPASPLSPSITPHFQSRLKTHLFYRSFPP